MRNDLSAGDLLKERVLEALQYIRSDSGRDVWWKCGGGIFEAFGGDAGFLVFKSWTVSMSDSDWETDYPGCIHHTWNWICSGLHSVTVATLFYCAKENGWPDSLNQPNPAYKIEPVVEPLYAVDEDLVRRHEKSLVRRHTDFHDFHDFQDIQTKKTDGAFSLCEKASLEGEIRKPSPKSKPADFKATDFPDHLAPKADWKFKGGNVSEFNLARFVKAQFPNATDDEEVRIVRLWFDRFREGLGQKEWMEVLQDYQRARLKVKFSEGAGIVETSFSNASSKMEEVPEQLQRKGYSAKMWSWCMALKELSDQSPDGVFFLSSRKFAQIIHKPDMSAYSFLVGFVRDGVLELVEKGSVGKKRTDTEKGQPRRASSYRFIWGKSDANA
jgi:hypothetical protein